jgi:hypothetical protein
MATGIAAMLSSSLSEPPFIYLREPGARLDSLAASENPEGLDFTQETNF